MADQALFSPMRAVDANGNPVPGALAYFYTSGTASLLTIQDADGVELSNPVEADSGGFFPQVFGAGPMRVIVKTAAGATLPGYPLDPVATAMEITGVASEVSFSPVASVPATDVQAAIEYVGDAVADVSGSLGTMAQEDLADRIHDQSVWTAGTNTTNALISPKKFNDTFVAMLVRDRPRWASSAQTITSGGQIVLTHGLGVSPRAIAFELVCTSADAGYSVDDRILVNATNNSTYDNSRFNSIIASSTTITVRFSDSAAVFVTAHKTTGAATALDNSKWSLYVKANA